MKTTVEQWPVDLVWAAAAAAHRVNGAYIKEAERQWNEDANCSQVVRPRSRDLMMSLLRDSKDITDQDRQQGQAVKRYFEQDITFRSLAGKITAFDTAIRHALAVEDRFDTVRDRLEMAVIASLPDSLERMQKKQAVDQRIRTSHLLPAEPGARVRLTVEVLSCAYSQTWNTWYVNAVSSNNEAVFFSYRQSLTTGSVIEIQGTVKQHREDKTQLNRVKVMDR